MEDDLFLSEQHPDSRRWGIVEDDGASVWLYLTEPDSTKLVAHCWLCNRVPAPAQITLDRERGGAPIAPISHVISGEPSPALAAERIRFIWGNDGQAVAVLYGEEVLGFIAQPEGPGYSRNLKVSSRFGAPVDDALFSAVFGFHQK